MTMANQRKEGKSAKPTLAQQRCVAANCDDLQDQIAEAATIVAAPEDRNLIDPVEVCGTVCLRVMGNVVPHVDTEDFQRFSYLFILRCDDPEAVLKQHGKEDLPVKTGMLVELDVHRRHSLKQNKDSIFLWAMIDSDESLDLADAEQRVKEKMAHNHQGMLMQGPR